MAHLTLNCPSCRRKLVHVPIDGLTLHLRCEEHGTLTFNPLVQLMSAEEFPAELSREAPSYQALDAA